MGSTEALAEALFPAGLRRVLALLYGQPERSFSTADVIRLAAGGTGGVHRLLLRLEEAGWVSATRVGNQRLWSADRACPAFAELRALVRKTIAPARDEEERAARPPRRRRAAAAEPAAPEPAAAVPPKDDGWKAW